MGEADLERYLFFHPLLNDNESSNNYITDNDLKNAETCLNTIITKYEDDVSSSYIDHQSIDDYFLNFIFHCCLRSFVLMHIYC